MVQISEKELEELTETVKAAAKSMIDLYVTLDEMQRKDKRENDIGWNSHNDGTTNNS